MKHFINLLRKVYFYCLPSGKQRVKFIYRHRNLFKHVGNGLLFQPRFFPDQPELIWFGDNVNVAANVILVNHDIISTMLNKKYGLYAPGKKRFNWKQSPIKIGNNVMIGSNVIILQDVEIGDNVVIGAGSVVTKDIPSNSVAAGVPCKVVGDFDTLVEKRKLQGNTFDIDKCWDDFFTKRFKQ